MNKIWVYWQNYKNKKTPDYVKLCHESIIKKCGKSFDVRILDDNDIAEYLPNIRDDFFKISQINNKSNYLRYKLLYEFGGMWLDSDIILLKDLQFLVEKLSRNKTSSLMATASPEYIYRQPESGFIISKKFGTTIGVSLDIIENKLNNNHIGHIFPWGSMGPSVIREAVVNEEYIHLNSKVLMPIGWKDAKRFLTNESINNSLSEITCGYMLYNEMFRRMGHNIFDMTRDQILNSNMLIGQIFRKALFDE